MEGKRIVTKTKRTLRLTGRERITRDRARLELILTDDGQAKAFKGALDLRDLGLPGEAYVIIEARRGSDGRRFEVGTVGNGSISITQEDLGELGSYGSGLQFRVLVVDSRTRKILSSAERLRPLALKEMPILLYVQRDIGKLAWKIEFSEEEGPLLVLNEDLPLGAFKSPQFACYGLPAVLREILDRAVRERAQEGEWEDSEEDELEDWKSQWFKFIDELTGLKTPRGNPDDPSFQGEYERWLDEVIQVFCERKTAQEWNNLLREYRT